MKRVLVVIRNWRDTKPPGPLNGLIFATQVKPGEEVWEITPWRGGFDRRLLGVVKDFWTYRLNGKRNVLSARVTRKTCPTCKRPYKEQQVHDIRSMPRDTWDAYLVKGVETT